MRAQAFIVATVFLVTLSTWAQNSAGPDTISKVLALENARNQAESTGDVHALDLILDGAMFYVDEDGALQSKAQFLNRFAERKRNDVQWQVTPAMNVHLYGDTAVVVGTYRARSTQGGTHEWSGRFIDTWVLKSNAWRCVAAQATPIPH